MTEKELIRMMRSDPTWMGRDIADCVEALAKERDAALGWAKDQHACADRYADRIEELEAEISTVKESLTVAQAKLAKAVEALKECEEEIDAYIQNEYPHDHPVQEKCRQRDYAANPARVALAELTGGKDD